MGDNGRPSAHHLLQPLPLNCTATYCTCNKCHQLAFVLIKVNWIKLQGQIFRDKLRTLMWKIWSIFRRRASSLPELKISSVKKKKKKLKGIKCTFISSCICTWSCSSQLCLIYLSPCWRKHPTCIENQHQASHSNALIHPQGPPSR